jgi:hypothetical protein
MKVKVWTLVYWRSVPDGSRGTHIGNKLFQDDSLTTTYEEFVQAAEKSFYSEFPPNLGTTHFAPLRMTREIEIPSED